MGEIIWKQGAENDLLQIFSELEEFSEAGGVRFVGKLDFTLSNLRTHPEMAPMFEESRYGVLLSVPPATACSIPLKHAASLCMRSFT